MRAGRHLVERRGEAAAAAKAKAAFRVSATAGRRWAHEDGDLELLVRVRLGEVETALEPGRHLERDARALEDLRFGFGARPFVPVEEAGDPTVGGEERTDEADEVRVVLPDRASPLPVRDLWGRIEDDSAELPPRAGRLGEVHVEVALEEVARVDPEAVEAVVLAGAAKRRRLRVDVSDVACPADRGGDAQAPGVREEVEDLPFGTRSEEPASDRSRVEEEAGALAMERLGREAQWTFLHDDDRVLRGCPGEEPEVARARVEGTALLGLQPDRLEVAELAESVGDRARDTARKRPLLDHEDDLREAIDVEAGEPVVMAVKEAIDVEVRLGVERGPRRPRAIEERDRLLRRGERVASGAVACVVVARGSPGVLLRYGPTAQLCVFPWTDRIGAAIRAARRPLQAWLLDRMQSRPNWVSSVRRAGLPSLARRRLRLAERIHRRFAQKGVLVGSSQSSRSRRVEGSRFRSYSPWAVRSVAKKVGGHFGRPKEPERDARPRGDGLQRAFDGALGRVVLACTFAAAILVGPIGCGGVTGGVAALLGDDDSSSSTVVVFAELSFLGLLDSSSSPAIIEFRLTQPNSVPASVAIRYQDPTTGELKNCTLVDTTFMGQAIDRNLIDLPTAPGPNGVVHRKAWDFAADLGSSQFVAGLMLDLAVVDASGAVVSGGGGGAGGGVGGVGTITVGDDPPMVQPITIPPPIVGGVLSGDIPFLFRIQDSSGDPLFLFVEYAIVNPAATPTFGESPPATPPLIWRPARPASGADQPPPVPTFSAVDAAMPPGFTEVPFEWASLADLGPTDVEVMLRLRAVQMSGELSSEQTTGIFRVDNNAPASVLVSEGPLFLNPDQRGGIPVPFRLFDPEGDTTRMVLQWTPSGTAFAPLPSNLAEIDALGASERRALGIGRAQPTDRYGRVTALASGSATVRLPELATSPEALREERIVGSDFDVLRSKTEPTTFSLFGPGEVSLPLADLAPWPGDPTRWAFVGPAANGWSLHGLNGATGESTLVAEGPGEPFRMDAVEDGWWVIAIDSGEDEITGQRVGLDGALGASFAVSRPTELSTIEGFEWIDASTAVFTGADGLWKIDLSDPADPALSLLLVLTDPRAVVSHPHFPRRLMVSLGSESALQMVDLDRLTRSRWSFVERQEFSEIEAAGDGQSLYLSFLDSNGKVSTVSVGRVDVGGFFSRDGETLLSFPSGTPVRFAVGADDAFAVGVASDPPSITLFGGVEQRRQVIASDVALATAIVDANFQPPLEIGDVWRLRRTATEFAGAAEGARHAFVWDSSEAPAGTAVDLRLVTYEADGTPSGMATAPISLGLPIARRFAVPGPEVSSFDEARDALLVDFDSDGRLDIVVAREGSLDFYSQPVEGFEAGGFDAALGFDSDGPIATGNRVPFADLSVVASGFGSIFAIDFFTDGYSEFVSLSAGNPRHMSIADIDLDGFGEVIVCEPDGVGFIDAQFGTVAVGGPGDLVLPLDGTLTGARASATGDIDHDGALELVVANQGDFDGDPGDLRIYDLELVDDTLTATLIATLDDGSGTMQPQDVAVVDVDGDGQLDIVSANRGGAIYSSSLSIFYGSVSGIFEAPVVLGGAATLDSFARVTVVDLDQDGDEDLIASDALPSEAGETSGRTVVFVQIAAREFVRSEISNSLGFARVGDVDADGHLDLLTAREGVDGKGGDVVTAQLRYQVDLGEFAAAPDVFVGEPQEEGSFHHDVAIGDFDSDGLLDVATHDLTENGRLVSWRRQSAPGVFESTLRGLIEPDPFVGGPLGLAAGDLNRDGRTDLVAVSNSRAYVYLQPASGGLAESALPDFTIDTGGDSEPMDVQLADLDGNGWVDLVFADPNLTQVSVAYRSDDGSAFGTFSKGQFFPDELFAIADFSVASGPTSVAIGDVDGDGRLDVVSANRFSDTVTVARQIDRENFEFTIVLQPEVITAFGPDEFSAPRSVVLADLDGNERLDIIVASAGTTFDGEPPSTAGNRILVFSQELDGSFSEQALGNDSDTSDPRAVRVADVNGDGRLDIIAANHRGLGSGSLAIFRQRPEGRFSPVADRLVVADRPTALEVADLDGDGVADAVSPALFVNELWTFFGDR